MVGFPRESRISRATIFAIAVSIICILSFV
jgi:hypothetical protein